LQKARKSGAEVEVTPGSNCIKSKVHGQLGILLKAIESWRTKLKISKKP
jgi:PDZ domain-containing secreted protein